MISSYKNESIFFSKPYEPFGGDISVKADLSNYATKIDIKNLSHIDTSNFASLKTEVDKLDNDKLKSLPTSLRRLKSKVYKLDIDKLTPVPVNLSKLSNAVKNEVIKKMIRILRLKIFKIKYLILLT